MAEWPHPYALLSVFRRKNTVSEATLITCGRKGVVVLAVQYGPIVRRFLSKTIYFENVLLLSRITSNRAF